MLLLLLYPAALLMMRLSVLNPAQTETLYSRSVYPIIARVVSPVFGILPFSAAEVLLCGGILAILFVIIRAAIRFRRFTFKKFLRFIITLLCIFTTGYFLFVTMWGLNYQRQPLSQNLGYTGGGPDKALLTQVMENEVQAVNSLAPKVKTKPDGSTAYSGGFAKIQAQVNDGYKVLQQKDGLLFHDITPHPKGVMLSTLMSYTSIEGIYIPFTCEPNLDTQYPDWVMPFTTAHECAHLQGFAKEDEANFVSYLACSSNPDIYFQYSAHLMAYAYVSNAMYGTDYNEWNKIALTLNAKSNADLRVYNDFINNHKSKAQDISNRVNDTYLKSQGQPGLVSYDMFVNLLAQKYRSGK